MSDDKEQSGGEEKPQTQPLPKPDPSLMVDVQNSDTPSDGPDTTRLAETQKKG